jgi:hypothetical protein
MSYEQMKTLQVCLFEPLIATQALYEEEPTGTVDIATPHRSARALM